MNRKTPYLPSTQLPSNSEYPRTHVHLPVDPKHTVLAPVQSSVLLHAPFRSPSEKNISFQELEKCYLHFVEYRVIYQFCGGGYQ